MVQEIPLFKGNDLDTHHPHIKRGSLRIAMRPAQFVMTAQALRKSVIFTLAPLGRLCYGQRVRNLKSSKRTVQLRAIRIVDLKLESYRNEHTYTIQPFFTSIR